MMKLPDPLVGLVDLLELFLRCMLDILRFCGILVGMVPHCKSLEGRLHFTVSRLRRYSQSTVGICQRRGGSGSERILAIGTAPSITSLTFRPIGPFGILLPFIALRRVSLEKPEEHRQQHPQNKKLKQRIQQKEHFHERVFQDEKSAT